MLKGEKQLSDQELYFTAVYHKLGKKITESKDKTSLTAFTTVITGRYQVCQPDSITITWHRTGTDEKLFEHTFSVQKPHREELSEPLHDRPMLSAPAYAGLGELEVNHIVEKRMTELRQKEEFERLREEHQKQQYTIKELEAKNQQLEQDIAAKETAENYMRILGMALPGLSKFFGGAGLLSLLSGPDTADAQDSGLGTTELSASPATVASHASGPATGREEMIQLLKEYMEEELSQQEVASVYLMFIEIQKDKHRIQELLSYITQSKPTEDETTPAIPSVKEANL